MAPTTSSTMATTCHGLVPSCCESVSRLRLTPISQVYSRQSIHDSDCSPVHRLRSMVDGRGRGDHRPIAPPQGSAPALVSACGSYCGLITAPSVALARTLAHPCVHIGCEGGAGAELRPVEKQIGAEEHRWYRCGGRRIFDRGGNELALVRCKGGDIHEPCNFGIVSGIGDQRSP
jgi:hypothetical protein